ncbi:twin-arginine translocase subunit TatC, partial [Halobium palmae]
DDRRVSLRRGRTAFAFGGAGLLVGSVLGRLVVLPVYLSLLRDHVAASPTDATPVAVSLRWLAELGLFVPVGVGLGVALPFLLVGAVRSGLAPRYTSDRTRGFVALTLVTFAAVYSPPDLPSFALLAVPSFVGFAVGIAWLEFG